MNMGKLLFILTLFLAVSATGSTHSAFYVDLPEGCFNKKVYPCALRVPSGFLRFERGHDVFQLGENSDLVFLGPKKFKLLKGRAWIQSKSDLTIEVQPEFLMSSQGEIYLEKLSSTGILIRNLDSELSISSSRLLPSEALPIGFQNWYSGMGTQGQIVRGVIRPIDGEEFLRSWLPLAGLSVAQAKRKVSEYREQWAQAVEMASKLYQEVVDRRQASVAEKEAQVQRVRLRRQTEKKKLREIFCQKNGLDRT
ncbi:MAG: hypothetical protein COT73_04490 [Bdellovibrio sp. CG10_big_fil_rev_8_21_14_0_10_47_8]|nr:MAG: hypothetical protein COT73_04490 [Bdellovibrio sp. CG10_big_fil_rev_8_21_14_0_10_47_8]